MMLVQVKMGLGWVSDARIQRWDATQPKSTLEPYSTTKHLVMKETDGTARNTSVKKKSMLERGILKHNTPATMTCLMKTPDPKANTVESWEWCKCLSVHFIAVANFFFLFVFVFPSLPGLTD